MEAAKKRNKEFEHLDTFGTIQFYIGTQLRMVKTLLKQSL